MSNVEQQVVEGDLTTGNFTLQTQLTSATTLTMSGYIFSRNTLEDISKQVDLYANVIDRQRSIANIPNIEARLQQDIKALQQLVDSANNLKSKVDSGKKLATAEKAQWGNLDTTIKQYQEAIEKGHRDLAEAKAKL